MKGNFRQQLLMKIAGGIGVIAVLVIGIALIGSAISAKADYIYSTRNELNARLNSINQLSQLKSVAAEVAPYVARLNQALPKKDALISMRQDLENIARQNNLSYGFKFVGEDAKIEEGLRSQKFQLSVQGQYQNIMNFIRAIERTTYFISLADIDLTASQGGYGSTMNGQVFFNG